MKNDLAVTPTFMGIFDSGGLSDNSVFWEMTSMRAMSLVGAAIRMEEEEITYNRLSSPGVVPGNLRIDIIGKGVHR